MSREAVHHNSTLKTDSLQEMILSLGATLVGFGDVSCGLAKEFAHISKAISLAILHPPVSEEEKRSGECIYIHQHLAIDTTLGEISKRIIKLLRIQGWRALSIPPDSNKMNSSFISRIYPLFPHKTAATCAGLGWIGKNGLLVNPQYGARLSWATVLTDAPLKVSPKPFLFSRCGQCRRCIDACPAGALSGAHWSRERADQSLLNVEVCRNQLEKNARKIGIFACGCCVLACTRDPAGKISLPQRKPRENEVMVMEMTSRERFFHALKGEPVDRPPVFSICQHATYEQMDKLGASWPEAHESGEKMAALATGGRTLLGFDAVRVPFCQTMEVEALGAVLKQAGREGIPSVGTHPYDIDDSPVFPEDFLNKGRIPQLLKAVKILKETIGNDVVIIGGIIGPFTLAVNLVGAAPMLKACSKKPEKILPFLEVAEMAGTTLAKALIEAGADIICVEDMMASMEMISPKIYRALAAPYEKKQFDQIPVPAIIHICGRMNMAMEDVASTGPAAISVETSVNVPEALASILRTGRNIPLIGGIDPVAPLWNGTPEQIKLAVHHAITEGISLISPGCSVAPETSMENLQAMADAAKEHYHTD